MEKNVCNICGGRLVPRNGRWVCEACGAFKAEEINNEEITLIYQANEQVRLGNFDEAEAIFSHVIELYPDNSQGYWGLLRAQYGIKYERDYNGKTIPTCYNASYESFFENPNYVKTLEKADSDTRDYYQREAARIEAIRKEWIEKAEQEPAYDVFLSYKDTEFGSDGIKTDDYNRVYEIYNHLTSLGYSVFFARKSLSGKEGEKNYEPYIFRALNTASVMIVYASKPEYVRATWVKNEWSRFLKRIEHGEKADNALAVAFSGFNASLLPKPLDAIQNFDVNSLTFIKELERYIEAVVTKSKLALPKITRVTIAANPDAKAKRLGGAKLRKAGSGAPIRKVEVTKASIESREFGLDHTPTLTGGAKNCLVAAEEYIKQRHFKEANGILDQVLVNDKRNGRALFLRLLAVSESESLDAFIGKLGTFLDFELLTSVIDYGERTASEELLRRLSAEIQGLFEIGKYETSLRAYRQIASYDSSSTRSLNQFIANEALLKLKSRDQKVDKAILFEHLDLSLSYLRIDENVYRESLQKAIQTLLELRRFEDAARYLDEYRSAFGEDRFYLVQNFVRESSSTCFEMAIKASNSDLPEKLTRVIESMAEKDGDDLLNRTSDICLSLISSSNFDVASVWSKFLLPYEFTKRKEFVSTALSSLIALASPENYPLFKQLLGFYGAGEETAFLAAYEKYAEALRSKEAFAAALEAYGDLIEYAPKSERIQFHRLLSVCKCAKDERLKPFIGLLASESDLGPVEAYLTVDPDKDAFVRRLNVLSSAAMSGFVDEGSVDCLKVFERLSSYYPNTCDENLSSNFLKLADAAKAKGLFEYATKYYSLSLGINGSNHVAYWGLLQSRLNCKTDSEVIKCPTPIADLPEFNNAIVAAGLDRASVSHYIECRVKQEEEIAKSKKRKKIKKNVAIWGSVLAFVAVIAVTLSILTKNVFIPNSIYETGISLINGGNYQEALDALEGLGYSDSDSQVLVAKAGLAFEEGDYETGISRIYDAGGTVEIAYDPDGGTTTRGTNAKQLMTKRSAHVTATATKPGYTFAEWKQQTFSITTSKEQYSAEVGLKASYEIVTYHISYDLGGGSLDNPITEYTVLASDFAIGVPNRRGYTFTGWSGSGFGGTQMTVTIPSGSVGDRSYVAHWVANEYLIIYDYGYGDKGSQIVTYDQNYELEEPTRPGYIFKGWKNGGESFTNGKWQFLEDIELTAIWAVVVYKIDYDLNGGTNSPSNPKSYTIEDTFTLSQPTKLGYSFAGWGSSLYASVELAPTVPLGTMGDISFTANWVPNSYVLRLDPKGGEVDYTEKDVVFDTVFDLPSPIRTGYDFAGWFDVSTDAQVEASTWSWPHDVSIYAKWSAISYAITYDLNGGTNSPSNPDSYTIEDAVTLAQPTRDGYSFGGWYENGDYSSAPKSSFSNSIGDRSFTALWTPNAYSIYLDANGGSCETSVVQTIFGQPYSLPTPYRSGYEFGGWYDSSSNLYEGGVYHIPSVVSLHAEWISHCDGLKFSLSSYADGYELTGLGTNTDAELYIPDNYNGKPVVSISSNVFRNKADLEYIDFPNTIVHIAEWNFLSCPKLTYYFDEAGNKYLGNYSNPKLILLKISDSLETFSLDSETKIVYGSPMSSTASLQTLSLEGDFSQLEAHVFVQNSPNLSSVRIAPSNVMEINCAFYGCESLTSAFISRNVVEFKGPLFAFCIGLNEIDYDGTIEEWKSIKKFNGWNAATGGWLGDSTSTFNGTTRTILINCTDGVYEER